MSRFAALAQRAALAAFGEPATIFSDGRRIDVRGIFHAAHRAIEIVVDAPVSTVRPVLAVRACDLPQAPGEGDLVEVAGRRYGVVDRQPDGFGMLTLVLQEA
ncbi:MAG: hypothetical protein N2690_04935 [Rhodocyclaceae bacterium]|nr:hypothetical protein [Rhodocyclaceae bacterium]